MIADQPLTENFLLSEFLRSEIAARRGIDNTPSPAIIVQLGRTAQLLEQVRALLGGVSIHISSGFRCIPLNRAIGSKDNSAHVDGRAADFDAPGFGSPLEVCRAIAASEIEFDQLIFEHTWTHIGRALDGVAPRGQVLTLMPGNTYAAGIIDRAAA